MPFGLQPIHILVVLIVALIVFGPKRLPQVGRWFGRTFAELRRGAREMADEFREEKSRSEQPAAGAARGAPMAGAAPAAGPGPAAGATPEPAAGAPGSTSTAPRHQPGTCPECGSAIPLAARFCNQCGRRLDT
jgi:sec-independent protein translocase protein TatA